MPLTIKTTDFNLLERAPTNSHPSLGEKSQKRVIKYFVAITRNENGKTILTPETIEVEGEMTSLKLAQHLEAAKKLQTLANEVIRYVPNHSLRKSPSLTREEREKYKSALWEMRRETGWSLSDKRVEAIKNTRIGQCNEYGLLIESLAQNQFEKILAAPYVVQDTHMINVIGRDPQSAPEDFSTWGDAAVVLDCWANEIYPASKIPDYLLSHADDLEDTNTGAHYPVIESFNSQIHSLKPYVDPLVKVYEEMGWEN